MRPVAFVLLILFFKENQSNHDAIPQHLYECYEQKFTILPMSIRTLIDIVRKVETSKNFYMDMRMLTNSIINRFWRDGIERDPNIIYLNPSVISYRTSGFQSHKYKLLYSYLIPNSGYLFPNDTLTLEERCTLHFMLSSSVDVWERGDEDYTCPDLRSFQHQWDNHQWSGVKKSTCPIEKGVISTNFGTISPSHVLGAISSALQPMEVNQQYLIPKLRKKLKYTTVNNVWASTISGDLAEVIVFQKPISEEIHIGPGGIWNNTVIPVHSYLRSGFKTVLYELWQFTDAEILGAVDGLILADEVMMYSNITYSLRLSQTLEMFYTNRGGHFPKQTRVCNRKDYFFNNLLGQARTIYEQTLRFAEVLGYYAPRYFTDNTFLEQHIEEGYNKFKDYASNIISYSSQPCPDKEEPKSKIHLFVLFDSTWSNYETLEVLTHISEQIDVSYYGSTITVLNSVTGDILTQGASTIGDLYLTWTEAPLDLKNTDSTNIHRGFLILKFLLEMEQLPETVSSLVTLVLTPSTPVSDISYDDIVSTLKSFKPSFPDMIFIYVTSIVNKKAFKKLTTLPGSQNDRIINIEDKNKFDLYKKLEILKNVPRALFPPLCTENLNGYVNFSTEQYITPTTKNIYRINPIYLCISKKSLTIKIINYNYGNIEVCLKRDQETKLDNTTCLLSSNTEDLYFTIDYPCSSNDCKPIFIEVNAKRSFGKCAEKDCRFSDDIRFAIRISGLKCLEYPLLCNSSSNMKSNFMIFICFVIIYLLI